MTAKNKISIVQDNSTDTESSLPAGTTLFDVIAALQDAADEYFCEDADAADLAVCASLVELRNRLTRDEEQGGDTLLPKAA